MQYSMFDFLYPKYKITKPIRLIELFAGYGSQRLAFKRLGVQVESWKICEWAVKSIQAYNDIHEHKEIDVKECSPETLFNYGISMDYNQPMTLEQITKKGEKWRINVLKNILQTNNLVNIQNAKAEDFEIVDKDKYEYILTYSFPCQDLSIAGKRQGMDDTSTRSGMLWEVERILNELKQTDSLPQVLLMENVPSVHDQTNVSNFNKWQLSLEKLGYKNYFDDLNAKDYGVPQNRNRCFMISILGDYSYSFPQKQNLELKLKDLLEDDVDEKYYLTNKQIECVTKWNAYQKPLEEMERTDNKQISPTLTTRTSAFAAGMILLKEQLCDELIEQGVVKEGDVVSHNYSKSRMEKPIAANCDNPDCSPTLTTRPDTLGVVIKIKNKTSQGYLEAEDGDGVDISGRMEYHRGTVQKGMSQTLLTSGNNTGVVVVGNYIYNLFFTIFNLCCIIDTKEKDKYERSRELLQILWEEIRKKEIWQEIRRFISIQEKKILQSNLYENELYEDRKSQSRISSSPSNSEKHIESITNREKMLDMWKNWKTRYTPQRWELSEQQFRQFNLFMQELSYEATQRETSMQDMWETNERFRVLQQTLFKIQEIWGSTEGKIQNGLRIRKLSPRECWRLMGVDDSDYDKVAKNQSEASLYHLAGDSIVVDVLAAIFKELL